MAWFWNSSNDDESYYDDDDDEYESEYSEEEEEDIEEEDDEEEEEYEDEEDDENDLEEETTTARPQEPTAAVTSETMDREDDEASSENELLEEEFAQLVGGEESSSSRRSATFAEEPSSQSPIEPDIPKEEIPSGDSMEPEPEEEVTTLEEKQSLLTLAAEHDRVDILQAILAESETKQQLLNGESLHIAISHGSVNAVNCLLRMGADPSQVNKEGNTAWALALDPSHRTVPSKREGIRHAFTAEALRCIGADEVERLQQLIAAGVPTSCDIGGRSLAEWTIDLGATQCQELVGASPQSMDEGNAVVNRFQGEDLSALENRLEELNNLSKALSEFLDNLAEEVSVCSGLLLVGSGAAALAAHVKSLKQQKTKLTEDVQRHLEALENSEDELAYWIKECGGVDILQTLGSQHKQQQQQSSGSPTTEEHDEKQRLKTQIAACETKIRMLRASIADLSEEKERNLLEVERRGLQGGVRLVRSLRDEIVDLEFQLSEINSGEAACRAKISLLQQHHKTAPKPCQTASAEPTGETDAPEPLVEPKHKNDATSTALIVRPSGGSHGFLPFSIWQMLLRIMGLSSSSSQHDSNRQAMIV